MKEDIYPDDFPDLIEVIALFDLCCHDILIHSTDPLGRTVYLTLY